MTVQSLYEKGDSLEALAVKARQWFTNNNVEVPEGAAKWQKCSVRRGEIPPGTGVTSLRRYGFNVTAFIGSILQDSSTKPYNYNPLTAKNISELGYELISETWKNKHKYLLVKCLNCAREEEITYGKLQEARHSNKVYCRYCRGVGGKSKELETYDTYEGFSIVSILNGRLYYRCNTCANTLERTMSHYSQSEYIVCEHCHPRENFGARHYTDLGYFDSKIEYEAYKILLKYFDPKLIVRQKKYDELFLTNTKHTADFYIPGLNLVLEVTSNQNNLGMKYKQTAKWKQSLSKIVKFAYSLSEVEDIVRSSMKVLEQTVANRRNVLCGCIVGRQRVAKSVYRRRRLPLFDCKNGV